MIRRGALRSSTAFLWKTLPSVHNRLVRWRVGIRVGGREMNSAPGVRHPHIVGVSGLHCGQLPVESPSTRERADAEGRLRRAVVHHPRPSQRHVERRQSNGGGGPFRCCPPFHRRCGKLWTTPGCGELRRVHDGGWPPCRWRSCWTSSAPHRWTNPSPRPLGHLRPTGSRCLRTRWWWRRPGRRRYDAERCCDSCSWSCPN